MLCQVTKDSVSYDFSLWKKEQPFPEAVWGWGSRRGPAVVLGQTWVLDCSTLALWTRAAHACMYTHVRATFTVTTQKFFQTLLFSVFITFLVKQSIVSKSVCAPPACTRMPAAPSPASLGGFRQPASVECSPSANSLQVFCQIWAYFHFSPDAGMHLPSC